MDMKKTVIGAGLLSVAFLVTSAVASASPCALGQNVLVDYSANPNTSPSGGLQNPGAGSPQFSCTITPLNFTNFSYLLDNGSFTTPNPDVSVETATLNGGQAIFSFDPNIAAGSDLFLEYQVFGPITSIDLEVSLAGTGFVNETVCTVFSGSATPACPSGDTLATLNVSGQGSNPQTVTASIGAGCGTGCTSSTVGGDATITFGSTQSEVWILKDISSGSAAFSDVIQSYGTVVPEPMTMSLMGAGLLGLGFLGRRRLKK